MTSYNVVIMTQPEKPKNDPVYNFKASCTSLAEQISENRIIEAKSIEDLTNSLGRFSFKILQACSRHKRPVLISRQYFWLFFSEDEDGRIFSDLSKITTSRV